MKISVQTGTVVYEYGFEKGYRLIRDAGFEAVEWNIEKLWDAQRIRNGNLNRHCWLAEFFDAAMEETASE